MYPNSPSDAVLLQQAKSFACDTVNALHSQYPNPEVLVEFIYQFQFEAWPIWASLHFFSGYSNVRYCLLISNNVQVNCVFETSFPFEPWGVFFFSLGIQRCLPGLLTHSCGIQLGSQSSAIQLCQEWLMKNIFIICLAQLLPISFSSYSDILCVPTGLNSICHYILTNYVLFIL